MARSPPRATPSGRTNKRRRKFLSHKVKQGAMAIFQRNRHASPLLRLPPELRNEVYGHALGGNRRIVDASPAARDLVSLLAVCKQIHAEAAELPLASNYFHFSTAHDLACFARRLLPQQRQCVKHVSLEVEPFYEALTYTPDVSAVRKLVNLDQVSLFKPSPCFWMARKAAEFLERRMLRIFGSATLQTVTIRVPTDAQSTTPLDDRLKRALLEPRAAREAREAKLKAEIEATEA